MKVSPPRRRNFLILAYHYPPSSEIGARRPAQFAKYLARLGHRVEVVTTTPQPGRQPGVTSVRDPANPLRKASLAGLTHMTLRKFFFPFEDSVICAVNLYRGAAELIRQSPQDWVIFSTSPPVSPHLAAMQLRRNYAVQWVADFRDPFAGAPTRHFALQPFPLPVRRLSPATDRWLERRIVHLADRLVANTDVVAGLWRSRYPQAAAKIVHIWNGFDPEEAIRPQPIPPRPYRLMVHLGSLYHGRHPGPLLAALDRLISSGRLNPSSLRLRLIGTMNYDGIDDMALFERLRDAGCVEQIGPVPLDKIPWDADFHLLIDWKEGHQVPAKIFEYIRAGRPILALASLGSPSDRILQNSGIPYLTLPYDAEPGVVDEKLLAFLRLPSEPVAPSDWFEQQFDAACRCRALVELVEKP